MERAVFRALVRWLRSGIMNNTYIARCSQGYSKGECPYLTRGAVSTCAMCSGVAWVRRDRNDYKWQYEEASEEENIEKSEEKNTEDKEN